MAFRNIQAGMATYRGHGGDRGDAYYANPTNAGPHPGVVVKSSTRRPDKAPFIPFSPKPGFRRRDRDGGRNVKTSRQTAADMRLAFAGVRCQESRGI